MHTSQADVMSAIDQHVRDFEETSALLMAALLSWLNKPSSNENAGIWFWLYNFHNRFLTNSVKQT